MTIYEELNMKPFINAAGTYTAVGGSCMSEETLAAMQQAARQHVDIAELQVKVQQRIAELTQNQASVVCNGAASGLYLCAVSAVARKYGKKARYLTRDEICQSEILAMTAHRIPYDFAITQLGVTQKWAGYANLPDTLTAEDLEQCITDRTAALFYFISAPHGLDTPGALPLEQFIELGQNHSLPVIVDAAAQLPAKQNLWKYTGMGADAALFSGGKDIRGPQSSGLIVGKQWFLDIVHETNFPRYGFGRMLKTGREEIAGLYSAIKQYINSDEAQRNEFAELCVRETLEAFRNSTVFSMRRVFPNEAGQSMAYVEVTPQHNIDINTVVSLLGEGETPVYVKPENRVFHINPMTMDKNDVQSVIAKLKYAESELEHQKTTPKLERTRT